MKGAECKFVKYMEGSGKRFVIPVYQRNYDWKRENCKQLYDDLVKIIREKRKSHFFGSIVSERANLKQRIFEEYLVDKWKPEETRIKLKPVKNDLY